MNPIQVARKDENVQNYQHKVLTNLFDTGFGVKYETNLSAYTPPHWHAAMELLLFVKGSVTCKFEHFTLRAKAGELYLINSHEVHETRCSRDAVYLCVHIQPNMMCRYVPNFDQLRFSLAHSPEDSEKAAAYGQLRQYMQKILQDAQQEDAISRLECQSSLFGAVALLVKHFSQPLAAEEATLRRSDMTRLEPLLEYTQLNHAEDLTLEEAANSMGLNKEYFCRLFKKNMGVSYLHYLYQVRTAAVCRELETCDDTIGQIAQRHGFKDMKMLNQYFKELYGCTPSEKRKFLREFTPEQ
jgi:AraC-like DNA-binding protein/mannose-6-phosphate isomerase-like protein (cupin superfamily)